MSKERIMLELNIIQKDRINNLNKLLRDEISRNQIDEYKLTALVEMGANGISVFPKNYKSGLFYAIDNKYYEYLKLLVNGINKENSDLIHAAFEYAAQNKDQDAAIILLGFPHLKFSRTENQKQTYLMFVAKSGLLKVAKSLVKKRANMHAKDSLGKSVLDYAKEGGNKEMLSYIKHIIKKDKERRMKIGQKLVV